MVRDIVADLVRLADKQGMTPRGVSRHKDLLEEAGLAKDDITEGVLLDATHRAKYEAEALLERAQKLNARLAGDEARITGKEPTQPVSKVRKVAERGKVVRGAIFGHSITAILRWMGKKGWNKEDAGVALATYGFGSIADSTIYIQLAAGRKGDATRGPVPELTKAEAKELLVNSK